jgi:hypothetical protein
MNGKAMSPTAKLIESHLKLQFKDIEKYLDFFDKNIEVEKNRAAMSPSWIDDEIFKDIRKYDSHISYPTIHSKALFIFMYSTFEHMFCWSACWISVGEDGGSRIKSLRNYKESEAYIRTTLTAEGPFASPEWKLVDDLRTMRNYMAHGGFENIIGVSKQSKYLLAARRVNAKFKDTFDVVASNGRHVIGIGPDAVRVAMACYKDFLFLLAKASRGL